MHTEVKLNDSLLKIVNSTIKTPRTIPYLNGEAGIGKTSWVEGLAVLLDTKVFVVQVNNLADKADIMAVSIETNEQGERYQVFYPMKTLLDAHNYAVENPDKPVIVFWDEINRATPDITSAVQTILTARVNGSLRLADNIRFIAAGNDRGNVEQLDSASITRFSFWRVTPDPEVFLDVIGSKLNTYVRRVVEDNPELLLSRPVSLAPSSGAYSVDGDEDGDNSPAFDMDAFDNDDANQITVPRTLEGLSDVLNDMSDDDLKSLLNTPVGGSNMLEQLVYAHIGATEFATKLLALMGTALTTNNNNTQPVQNKLPDRPDLWSDFVAANSVSEINDLVMNATPEQRGEVFAYLSIDQSNIPAPDRLSPGVRYALASTLFSLTEPIIINQDLVRDMFNLGDRADTETLSLINESRNANGTIATKYSLFGMLV